jgi:hypothetical protein
MPSQQDFSRRQLIVEHLRDKQIGDLVTYDELARVLNTSDTQVVRLVVSRAVGDFEDECNCTLTNRRGQGYVVVAGKDQIRVATKRQRRGTQQFKKALQTVRTTDLTLVPQGERPMVIAFQMKLAHVLALAVMTEERVAVHDELLREITQVQYEDRSRQRATEADVAEMKRQIEELQQARADRMG